MRTDDLGRRFSREIKLAGVQRMAAGTNVSKLSRELGIFRKGLYQWQKQFRTAERRRCKTPGVRGVLPVLAASTTQAGRAFMHIAGVLQHRYGRIRRKLGHHIALWAHHGSFCCTGWYGGRNCVCGKNKSRSDFRCYDDGHDQRHLYVCSQLRRRKHRHHL
ncbi:transposase [Rhizobium sp. AB2/73]|uniref:transposase n=1 Tax=Rhizobium sp. AB2/73 TaxID=2795216 RepID=UPI001C604938|nr:transposase [Rhizobium sp. AB2/73]QYA13688.1 transposase [Rhizobium sp. AB2/73]UEQ80382.1 transposase [Rhizobium sp. AB2/73]